MREASLAVKIMMTVQQQFSSLLLVNTIQYTASDFGP